jgi:hypothetical protein
MRCRLASPFALVPCSSPGPARNAARKRRRKSPKTGVKRKLHRGNRRKRRERSDPRVAFRVARSSDPTNHQVLGRRHTAEVRPCRPFVCFVCFCKKSDPFPLKPNGAIFIAPRPGSQFLPTAARARYTPPSIPVESPKESTFTPMVCSMVMNRLFMGVSLSGTKCRPG